MSDEKRERAPDTTDRDRGESEIWGRSRQLEERVIKWIGYSKREKSMETTWERESY